MRRKHKILIRRIILVLVILFVIILVLKLFVFKGEGKEDSFPKVVDTLSTYDYTLEDRDTAYMKEVYNELKDNLKSDEINMEEYSKSLTKLFIIDLFTIENKRNKYDVGGTEYVYPDSAENYRVNVEDTLYKNLKTNSDGKRKQELPVVKNVTIDEVKNDKFTIGENDTYDAYVIDASWEYEKELGYDKKATITSIVKEDKIYIVEYKVGE